MTCVICQCEVLKMHFAIRDMKVHESYIGWLWRHVHCILAFGLTSRKHAVILPVCDGCAKLRLEYNIAGVSEEVA